MAEIKVPERFDKKMATIFTDERGQHLIMMPGAIPLFGVIKTVVIDDVNDSPAVVTATFVVNLCENALQAYKGYLGYVPIEFLDPKK